MSAQCHMFELGAHTERTDERTGKTRNTTHRDGERPHIKHAPIFSSEVLSELLRRGKRTRRTMRPIFMRESSFCLQRVLAIVILLVRPSVCPSVRHTGGSVKNGAR